MRSCVVRAERNDLPRRVELVDRRLRFDRQAEHPARLDRPLVQEEIVAVQVHRHAERPLGGGDAGDVIDVRVREQDVPDVERAGARRTDSSVGTSSPGSMRTASRVSGHDTTKPFLKNGPTACDSIMITR